MNQDSSTKQFSFVAIGRITTVAIQAILYLLFASLLDPIQYGELNVILALALTFSTISTLGLHFTLQVYRAKGNSNLSNQVVTLFVITSSMGALILLAIDPFAAILCIATSFFMINQANLLGLKKYKKFMIISILKSCLFLAIPILLYFLLEIPGIVLGMAISNFVGSIPFFKTIKIQNFSELKNQYKVITHNFGVAISGTLPFMVDKLLISYLFGFFIVGIYQFNLQIFIAMGVLPQILYSFLLSEESVGIRHRKISYLSVGTSILLALIAFSLTPVFVNEFFPKYSEGISSLQILVFSLIPQTIMSIYHAKLMSRESTTIGYSAIVQVGSFLFFITMLGEFLGLEGLALAVLFSLIINATFVYILFKRSK